MQIPVHFKPLTLKYTSDHKRRKRFSAPPPSPPARANDWLYERGTAFASVTALYTTERVQCNQCGLRVPHETMVEHKQAHFNLNRALKKQTSRPWCLTVEEFAAAEEEQVPLQTLPRMVQDSRHCIELCFVCMLGMDLPEWDNVEEEWYVPNCVEHSSGQRIHASCSAELAPDKKSQQILQSHGGCTSSDPVPAATAAAAVHAAELTTGQVPQDPTTVHSSTAGGSGGRLPLVVSFRDIQTKEEEGQIRLLEREARHRRGAVHGTTTHSGKSKGSNSTSNSSAQRDSTGRRQSMDPTTRAIEELLNKSDVPSSISAALTVSREHLDIVLKNLENAQWVESSPDWIQSVTYTVPAHPEDVEQSPVLLSYVEDGDVRSYRDQVMHQVQLRASNESGVQVQVQSTRNTKARPPNPRTRYTQIEVQNYRVFTKGSSSAPGILWTFTVTVHWKSDCIRGAQMAIPEHTITVALTRDYSARGGRGPDESPAARTWMSENLLAKLRQVCLSDLCLV